MAAPIPPPTSKPAPAPMPITSVLVFLQSVFDSYQLIPVFEFPNVQPGLFPLMDFFIVLSGQVLALAVQIASPVIIAILMADIILGLTNRVAPQINVWELGFNIRGFIGILTLYFAITLIARQIHTHTGKADRNVNTVIQVFSGTMPPQLQGIETPEKIKRMFEPTGEEIPDPSIWDKTIRSLKKEEMENL